MASQQLIATQTAAITLDRVFITGGKLRRNYEIVATVHAPVAPVGFEHRIVFIYATLVTQIV